MTLIYRLEPFKHQKLILENTWQLPYWALLMEMGTGKTKVLIDTILNLYLAGKLGAVLYVAKKGEYSNFSQFEIPKHWVDTIPKKELVYTGYRKKADIEDIKDILRPFDGVRILSMPISTLIYEKGMLVAESFCKTARDAGLLIAVDESTIIKEKKSKRSKAMMKLKPYSKYRRIMTGTVIPNSPTDIWSQAMFLGATSELGSKTLTAFKSEFVEFERKYYGSSSFLQAVGTKNLDELSRRMSQFSTMLLKKDCLDLPDKIYVRKSIELTDDQKKAYDDLVNFAFTEIDDEYVDATHAMALRTMLHQITCGQLRVDDGYKRLDTNKPDVFFEATEELFENGKKVVLWCPFRESQVMLNERLRASLGRGHHVWMSADLTAIERQNNIQRFKEDKDVLVFLANPQSSGYGITLTEASVAYYYGNTDNYEYRIQSEDRLHRIGQTNKCVYVDLHCVGTVEDSIIANVREKKSNFHQVVRTDELLKTLSRRTP